MGWGSDRNAANVRRIVSASRNEDKRPHNARSLAQSLWMFLPVHQSGMVAHVSGRTGILRAHARFPEGDGGFAAVHRFRDVPTRNHPGKGRMGCGEGGNSLPHRAGNASAAAWGSLRTCLPGAKAAGDVTGAVTPPALCQNKASCASCGNIAAMCSSGVIPSANAAMGRNIERYPVSVTPGRGLSW